MIFEFIRNLTCNFEMIESYIPRKGNILDVGCGHGIFSKLLVEKFPKRKVFGIDPSYEKIKIAKKNYSDVKHLSFTKAYVNDLKKQKFDCICVIDVMYLLPKKEKILMLKRIKQLLNRDGKLALVINGKEPKWIFFVLKIQEKVMSILKFTYSDYSNTHFMGREEYRGLLKKAGFKIDKEKKIKSFLPYPHTLFYCSKEN